MYVELSSHPSHQPHTMAAIVAGNHARDGEARRCSLSILLEKEIETTELLRFGSLYYTFYLGAIIAWEDSGILPTVTVTR